MPLFFNWWPVGKAKPVLSEVSFYPALTGSKAPASTSGRSTDRKSPIGWTNN